MKRATKRKATWALLIAALLTGGTRAPAISAQTATAAAPSAAAARVPWLHGATCYEVFVRSFYDGNGDGIGDLRGLTQKLDYINDGNPRTTRDLGAQCVWLMPVAESPGYHGYDVSDHYRVERDYGTNADFKAFVSAAHARGIKVLVDMVPNHVSSEYPAFQTALRDTTSPARRLFRWSPVKGPDNRWGGNTWHKSPLRDEYYYGFFWQGMPDLNYELPDALAEMQNVATFWLTEMDVDGFRLDAVKFLVERGAQVDDTPGTHRVLRDFAAHVRRVKPGAFTIGEVFDSTGALLPYYPNQLDAYFAFEIADSLIHGIRRGDARGLLAPVLRLQRAVSPSSYAPLRYAPFLRNHDQPRTRTEFGGDVSKARLAATLMLTLPGLPFVYYGEELGMLGDKPDEQIRTPMAWTLEGPHAGFTTGTPWEPLQRDSLESNVAVQDGDDRSLLSLYRTLIHERASHPALASGALSALSTSHATVSAFVRRSGRHAVLVIANVGDSAVTNVRLQSARTGLSAGRYAGRDMLGTSVSTGLRVRARGALSSQVVLPTIPPKSAYVFDLTASPAR